MQHTNLSIGQRPKLLLSSPTTAGMSKRLGGSRKERADFLLNPGSYIRKHGDFSAFSDIQIITNEKELENVNGGMIGVAALAVAVVVAAVFHMAVVATNAVIAAAAVAVYAGVWFWGVAAPQDGNYMQFNNSNVV